MDVLAYSCTKATSEVREKVDAEYILENRTPLDNLYNNRLVEGEESGM